MGTYCVFSSWSWTVPAPYRWDAAVKRKGTWDCHASIRVLRTDPCPWSSGLCPLWPRGLAAALGEQTHCQVYSYPGQREHLCTASFPVLTVRPSSARLCCALCLPLFTAFWVLRPFPKVRSREVGEPWWGKAHSLYLASISLSCRAQPFMAFSTTPKKWTDLRSDDVRTSRENLPSALSPIAFICPFLAFLAWPHHNNRSSPL